MCPDNIFNPQLLAAWLNMYISCTMFSNNMIINNAAIISKIVNNLSSDANVLFMQQ